MPQPPSPHTSSTDTHSTDASSTDTPSRHWLEGMGRLLRRVAAGVALASAAASSWAAYTVKVEISMPKNSAGEKLLASQPVSTKLSPCLDNKKTDAISIKVTYDITNPFNKKIDRDLFVILYNPDNDPKYLMAVNPIILPGRGSFVAYGSMRDMDTAEVRSLINYLPREANFLGANAFELFPGGITVDNVLVGTWQFVAIIGDRTSSKFSFDDPSSWDAWDVATVVFGQPWSGKQPGKVCK